MSSARYRQLCGVVVALGTLPAAWGTPRAESLAAAPEVLTAEQFRSSVHSGRTAPGQPRAFLTAMLNQELQTAQQAYALLDEQVAALRKAGDRDIDQWLEQVDKACAKFAGRPLTADELAAACREIIRLREALQTELFGKTSFFRMALNDVVRTDQRRIFVQGAVAQQQQQQAAATAPAAAAMVRLTIGIRLVAGPNGERLYEVPEEYVQQRVLGSATATEASVRQQFSSQLAAEIRRINTVCQRNPLTDGQQQKLTLAGRGDVKEWFDRLAELQSSVSGTPLEQAEYARLSQQMSTLSSARTMGLFGPNSLFCKTLQSTLTDAQMEQYETNERVRTFQTIEAILGSPLPGGISLHLPDSERRKLALLIAERRPRMAASPYLPYLVILQAGELEDEIKPLMAASQWERFQQAVTQARRVEPTLRNMGLWPITLLDDEAPGER